MPEKIAIIGDSESIKGFAAIGFEIIECENPEKANHILRSTVEADVYSIIYMTEEMFLACEKERKKHEEKTLPAIIPVPGLRGNTGIGTGRLSDFVEKAVGSDIIFNN